MLYACAFNSQTGDEIFINLAFFRLEVEYLQCSLIKLRFGFNGKYLLSAGFHLAAKIGKKPV